MKYLRLTLIAAALATASIGLGVANTIDKGTPEPEVSRCARCGDGVCAKSCENALSCPQDCGGVPSTRQQVR